VNTSEEGTKGVATELHFDLAKRAVSLPVVLFLGVFLDMFGLAV
jgi:hypothetical protein